LLVDGIGNVKVLGHRLEGNEIDIASNLLASLSERIAIEKRFGSHKDIATVLKKLNSCSVEVRLPEVTQKFLMLSSYEITSTEVVLKLNEHYKEMFNIL
tara:strand:- start:2 stop:298 length:297 start_codon:yes stop_codon:yes gene_type:complete